MSGRVSTACARCRRQKLKCDATKPCTMCVRSGAACQPRVTLQPRSRRPKTRSEPALSTASSRSLASPNNVSPSNRQPAPDSVESMQFGANRSAMSLAVNMYQSLGNGTHKPAKNNAIPGPGAPPRSPGRPDPGWRLRSMQMPPRSAMEALLGVYFDKMHWFIWIFHEPSFMTQARQLLSADSWRRQDMSKVLVTLTVAALGLKCAIQNTSPDGRRLLDSITPDPQSLVEQMIGEVRLHLLELLDDACIETVQVSALLGAFYMFHGSPGLAWAMVGMAVRASYGLALHCASDDEEEYSIATQVRRRCWNHITVADTFTSQIYGRPASLDPAFSELRPVLQMDDTVIPGLSSAAETISYNGGLGSGDGRVTAVTFHWLKYKLYEIIRETLSTFRLLRPHNPMTLEDVQSLIDAVQRIDGRLAEWTRSLPSAFDKSIFGEDGEQDSLDNPNSPFPRSFYPHGTEKGTTDDPTMRRLRFQAWLLQDTYNAAVILAHRPLLEYRLSADYRRAGLSKTLADLIGRSFDVSVKAALRISRTPVMQFEHEFCLAFIFIHLFTAGVILCIPPTSHPNSALAQEAKAGVFRIIQSAKALRGHSHLAKHTEQLLSDLLKLSLYREVDLAFKEERPSHESGTSSAEIRDSVPPPDGPGPGMAQAGNNAAAAHQTAPTWASEADAHAQLHGVDEEWANGPYFVENDTTYLPALDLPLDEAFGAFGQAMFNLMPDDPLNNWGWGKGFM